MSTFGVNVFGKYRALGKKKRNFKFLFSAKKMKFKKEIQIWRICSIDRQKKKFHFSAKQKKIWILRITLADPCRQICTFSGNNIMARKKGSNDYFWRSGRKGITKYPKFSKTICPFELIGEQKYPRLSAGRLPHQIASDFDDFFAVWKLSISAIWKPKFCWNPMQSQ